MNSGHPSRWFLAVVLFLAVLSVAGRFYRLNGRLDDHNTWRQTDTATIARNFLDEPRITHPRINWGAPGPGYVEAEFQLYTYTVSLLYRILGHRPVLGRIVSIIMGLVATAVFFVIARRFLPRDFAALAGLLFLNSPLLFRYSRAFMPDVTALALYVTALLLYLAWLDRRTVTLIAFSGFCTALAILVKPTSVHIGLVFMVLAFARLRWAVLKQPHLYLFAFIALFPAVIYFWHAAQLHLQFGNTFGVISGGDPKWGSLAMFSDPMFYLNIGWANAGETVSVVGAACAVYGLFRYRAAGWYPVVVAAIFTLPLYYIITGRYSGSLDLGRHYHIYAVPYVTLAFVGTLHEFSRRRGPAALRWAAVVVVFSLALQSYENIDLFDEQSTRMREIGMEVAELTEPDDLILVTSWDHAYAGRQLNNYQDPRIFYYAWRQGRCIPYDQLDAKWLRMELAHGLDYLLVTVPEAWAEPDFWETVHRRMVLQHREEDWSLYQIIH